MNDFEKKGQGGSDEPKKDGTPFRDKTEEASFIPYYKRFVIKKFESDPERVVRMGVLSLEEKEREVIIGEYKRAKIAFEELRDVYHIKVPDIQYVVGPADTKSFGYIQEHPALYTISERIHGYGQYDNLYEILKSGKQEDIEKVANEFEDVCINWLGYFKDKHSRKAEILWDIRTDQFLYGRRAGEDKDSIYLVDIDPLMDKDYNHSLSVVIGDIERAENFSGKRFARFRTKFKMFFESLGTGAEVLRSPVVKRFLTS